MAEWSNYLKQAVANVEQRLDQVLLDSKEVSLPKRQPGQKRDLSQRVRQAVAGTPGTSAATSRTGSLDLSRPSTEREATPSYSPDPNPGSRDSSNEPGKEPRDTSTNDATRDPAKAFATESNKESTNGAIPETSQLNQSQTPQNTNEPRLSANPNDHVPRSGRSSQRPDDQNTDQEAEQSSETGSTDQESSQKSYTHFRELSQVSSRPATPQAKQPTPQPTLKVVDKFVLPPDLGPALSAAQTLALSLQNDSRSAAMADATLDLVDLLEATGREVSSYTEQVNNRLTSLHSKIAVLSEPHFETPDPLERKIALLMDEGQRLSAQELKLSTHVRRMRATIKDAEKRAQQAQSAADAASNEATVLRAERSTLLSEKRELQALAEHYRSQVEPRGSYGGNKSGAKDQARLEAAELAHESARQAWQEREVELLQRIAELEQAADKSAQVVQQANNRLNARLREAQAEARDAQDQVLLLQEQLDALKASAGTLASHEIFDGSDTTEIPKDRDVGESDRLESQEDQEEPSSNHEAGPTLDEDYAKSEVHTEPELSYVSTDNAMDRFIDLGPTEAPMTRKSSAESLPFDVPERESLASFSAGEGNAGANIHVVSRLTRTVRHLESELAATRKAAELASSQRDDAQAEVVELLDAQDELTALRAEHESAEKKIEALTTRLDASQVLASERHERIAELEADVADVKEMYRDQIETLVQEIARLSERN